MQTPLTRTATKSKQPNMFERAAALMRPTAQTPSTSGAKSKQPSIFERAAALVARETRDPRQGAAEIATANAKIADLTAQVTDLRAESDKLKSTLAAIESGTVVLPASIAALGFPAAGLPGALPIPEHTLETLHAQFREETDIVKRADLAARIAAMRDR